MSLIKPFKLSLATIFLMLSALTPTPLVAQKGKPSAYSSYGYARIKPLPANEEKAMGDKVEQIKRIPTDTFEAHEFEATNKVILPYRLLKPKDYDPKAKYPLVIVLHSSAAIGHDNAQQLGIFAKSWAQPEHRIKYPCFVIAPQFSSRSVEYFKAADGTTVSRALPPLYAAIELIESFGKEFNVDTRRIYIMGFSMGGSSAMHALFLRPGMFAASICISGVPNPEMARRIVRIPLWLMHGNRDPENSFDADKLMYETLVKNGAKRVRFWEFEGVGHEVPSMVFGTTELPDWLFNRHR